MDEKQRLRVMADELERIMGGASVARMRLFKADGAYPVPRSGNVQVIAIGGDAGTAAGPGRDGRVLIVEID
jgi:hypothetical protein